MRLLSIILPLAAYLALASCSPAGPSPAAIAPTVREALLTAGLSFLKTRADSMWPPPSDDKVFLGVMRIDSPYQQQPQAWLRSAAGSPEQLCYQPEAQCFHGHSGRLFALGYPKRGKVDTLSLEVGIRTFEPYPADPRVQLPGGLRPTEPLSRWTSTYAWILTAVADSGGAVRITGATGPTRTVMVR